MNVIEKAIDRLIRRAAWKGVKNTSSNSSDRTLARELARIGGGKIIHGHNMGNISPDIEWIKWLEYQPEFEKERYAYLSTKTVASSTDEDLEEILYYRRNSNMIRLFKIYGTKECSEEEYMMVYDFMCNESIVDLMLSKLTEEELKYAKEEISKLLDSDKDKLKSVISDEQQPDTYKKLSMVDAFILHIISDIDYTVSMSKLESEISAQLEANTEMERKSYYYASNPNKK